MLYDEDNVNQLQDMRELKEKGTRNFSYTIKKFDDMENNNPQGNLSFFKILGGL